jgi:hypothetical protein
MQIEICPNGSLSILEFINGENHRRCLSPGDPLTGESQAVIDAATTAWTPAVIAEHTASVAKSVLTATQIAAEKSAVIEEAREMRSEIFNALMGIERYDISPSDSVSIAAIATARQALKDLPTHPAVVAAVTGAETHAAVMSVWKTISETLELASPAAATAFKKTAMW